MEAAKAEFLKEFGDDYGYPDGPKSVDEIRATEFKRLDQNGVVYLDHAGATLYSELQMESVYKDLSMNVYGNPHSQSDSNSASLDIVREARQQVLEYFNASPKDYRCIFTSGATAALKLVGEAFPWSSKSHFMYTMENHNSVLGIREYALSCGASAFAIDIEDPVNANSIKLWKHPIQRRNGSKVLEGEATDDAYSLFAFPSECNFSGLRFSLDLVKLIKEDSGRILEDSSFHKGRWLVLIDAAKGSATHPPDLSKYPADFVVLSFYKLFGYPTGLGALLVKNDAAKLLKKTYFSGGTVAASFADMDFTKRREAVEELFEDGTISFLSIASIRYGFKIINSLTPTMIYRHTASLTMYLKKMLLSLKHRNGASVCKIYGNNTSKESGPIVSFNLRRSDGSWFGYREVEKLASLSGFQLRTGCFCNPGSCAKYLGLSHADLLSNLEAGHVCWDENDVINGKPTGAVRISFGFMSTFEDAKKFVDFVRNSFVSETDETVNGDLLPSKCIPLSSEGYYLKSINVYPIKSCGGFSVKSWPLSSTGLQHDREWLLKSLTGEILTQKKVPEMCFIGTFIDLDQRVMHVESPRCAAKLQISLKADLYPVFKEEMVVHYQSYEVQHYENEVNLWFSSAVGRPCVLVRCVRHNLCSTGNVAACRDMESQLSFANEAQFLLISEESVADLNSKISSKTQRETIEKPLQVNPLRFRPNLVVSGGEPYAEDGWGNLKIGKAHFTSLGGCNRCQIINIVQVAGQVKKSSEPLATLASYRRAKGKIVFGILLRYEREKIDRPTDPWLQVGQEVHPDSV